MEQGNMIHAERVARGLAWIKENAERLNLDPRRVDLDTETAWLALRGVCTGLFLAGCVAVAILGPAYTVRGG